MIQFRARLRCIYGSACKIAVVWSIVLMTPGFAAAQRFATSAPYQSPAGKSPTAELVREIGIEQHLNGQLPLDAALRDEQGREVRLGDFFVDQPVILALVQFRCPMLCTQVLNGFLKSSQAVSFELGRDYQFVAISFDAKETFELGAEKKQHFVRVYRRPGGKNGFHFLTADQESIDRIARAIGFRYRYMAESDQFAHASGLMIATPEGRLNRYLYGIEYSPQDLRLGLVDSAARRIGSPADQVLLLCYHYDPLTGKYGLAIAGVLRLGGIVTMFTIGTFLLLMYRRERNRPKLIRPSAIDVDSSSQDTVVDPR